MVSAAKSLGIYLDASFSVRPQVTNVMFVFLQLWQFRQLAPFLSQRDLTTVIHITVTSRLDYCNMLYVELPLKLTQKLQLVQNAAAHVLPRPHQQQIASQWVTSCIGFKLSTRSSSRFWY